MPRQTRSARSRVGGLGVVSNPSVQSRVIERPVAQLNSQLPMQNMLQQNAILDAFAKSVGAGLETMAQADFLEQKAEIERGNLIQQSQGQADALTGRGMSEDPNLVNDYDYLDAYKATSGKKAGITAARDWEQNVLMNWTPEKGDIQQLTEEWVRQELGQGTGDPVYDTAMMSAFYQSVADPIRSAQKKGLQYIAEKGLEELNQSVVQQFLTNPTFSGADFNEAVSRAQALLGPSKTKGQAAAHVLSQLKGAAAVSENPADRIRLQRLIDSESLDDQGRTFSDLFPEAAAKLSAEMVAEHKNLLTMKALQEADSIEAEIAQVTQSADPEKAAEVLAKIASFESRFGGGSATAKLRQQANAMMKQVAKEQVLRKKHQSCAMGGPCALTDKELRDLPDRLHGIDPFAPGLDEKSANERVPVYAKTLYNYYQGLGRLPKTIGTHLSNALLDARNPVKQAVAFQTLSALEGMQYGLGKKVLAGNKEAQVKFQMLWDMRHSAPADQLVDIANSVPDLADRADQVDLAKALGAENQDEAVDWIINGKTGVFTGWGSDSDESLVSMLVERGVVSGDDVTELSPELKQRAVDLFRYFYAAQTASSSVPDVQAIRERVADVLASDVEPEIIPNADEMLFGLWKDDKVILRSSKVQFRPADPEDKRLAPLMNREVTNPAGNEENPYETLVNDVEKMSALTDGIVPRMTLDDKAAKGLVQLRIDDGGAYPVPLVLPIGRKVGLKSTGGHFELTGDLEEDVKILNDLSAVLGLPDNLVLVKPAPGSSHYQVYIKPVWRNVDEGFMSDEEMRKKAADPNWMPKEEKGVMFNILKKFRSLFQSSGKMSATDGLTKLDEEPENFETPDEFVDKTVGKVLDQSGPGGLDQSLSDTYEDRRFEMLASAEGYRAKAYWDLPDSRGVRRLTVGYGFNLDAEGAKKIFVEALGSEKLYEDVRAGRAGLSRAQARKLFDASVREAERLVATKFKGVPLKEHQRLALVSLAYNNPKLIGPNLTRLVREGKWKEAAEEILYRSNRTKNKGLARRRYMEAQTFIGPMGALPEFKEYIANYS